MLRQSTSLISSAAKTTASARRCLKLSRIHLGALGFIPPPSPPRLYVNLPNGQLEKFVRMLDIILDKPPTGAFGAGQATYV